MKMKYILLTFLAAAICGSRAVAQQPTPSPDLSKYEVGMDFTSMTSGPEGTVFGNGARFSYNLNRHLALEAAAYFSSGLLERANTGSITEGLFGVKAGQRFEKFGIFGKVRPGFLNYSRGAFDFVPTGSGGSFPFVGVYHHRTDFALDLGGVFEFYPTKNMVVRLDAGTTLDRIGRRQVQSLSADPTNGVIVPFVFESPGYTRHHFQFISGVAYRF
ncbi:MAG TPA: hypothetical protein VE961_15130 [Pyrinomonadaceae bacterium]|nr:hypothetical protein [Pyrinomonadaceae bacterium]